MALFEERGDPADWVELTGEENRCLLGLQAYYMKIEDKTELAALSLAWKDLKKEFFHLETHSWFKSSNEGDRGMGYELQE